MRYFIALSFMFLVSGCSSENSPSKYSNNHWCFNGDAEVLQIKDRFTIPGVLPVGVIKIKVDSACLDPVAEIDPSTNPYRNSHGMNMRFCIPFEKKCLDDKNAYMTVFKEDTKISLRSSLDVARSKDFISSGSGVDIYKQVASSENDVKVDQTYYVDSEENYVVSCVRENTSKQRCLFVAADSKFPFSYYLTVHGDPGVKWEDVYEKMSRFFNYAVVSQ